jgi:hypothetical protein
MVILNGTPEVLFFRHEKARIKRAFLYPAAPGYSSLTVRT